jgi:hypothetical protein
MKKLLGILKTRRSLLLASAFAPMCFSMLIGSVGSSRAPEVKRAPVYAPTSDIKIVNNTTTLDVILQTTADNHLLIRLKNISSKGLNGYVVAVNDTRIKGDISSGDSIVSSGETTELEIPTNSSSIKVTILAAMFADGSIEADPVLKTELTEWRIALKKELARGLAALDEILGSPDVYTTKALDRLNSRLSLPLHSDTSHSHSDSGTRDARDSFNSAVQSLRERQQRHGSLMQRQRLLDLKGRIQRRIASL